MKNEVGTLVKVSQKCQSCDHKMTWTSQPYLKDTPAGNVNLSSGILYSGSSPSKVLKMLSHMNIPCISYRTYMNHQSHYMFPVIDTIWKSEQTKLLNEILSHPEKSVEVSGDGCAVSPGHSAKFRSYALMDLKISKIITIQLVQVEYIIFFKCLLYFKFSYSSTTFCVNNKL